eukprot:s119_g41.t1
MLLQLAKLAAPVANAVVAARRMKRASHCAQDLAGDVGQALHQAATTLSEGAQNAAKVAAREAIQGLESQLQNVLLREEEWHELAQLCRDDVVQAGKKSAKIMDEYLQKGQILAGVIILILNFQAANLFLISLSILVVPFINNNVDILQEKVLLLASLAHGIRAVPYIQCLKVVVMILTSGFVMKIAARCSEKLLKMPSNVPIGTVISSICRDPAPGYLPCDGREHPTNRYPELAGCLEEQPGEMFRVPDFRGRCVFGAGGSEGLTARALLEEGGQETVTLVIENLPPHEHVYRHELWLGGQGLASGGGHGQVGFDQKIARTDPTGASRPFDIMPPWVALSYFIWAIP